MLDTNQSAPLIHLWLNFFLLLMLSLEVYHFEHFLSIAKAKLYELPVHPLTALGLS